MTTTPTPPGADPATPVAAGAGPGLRTRRSGRLFPTIWRWHFYASLLSIPVIVLLCLSGIVYLFKPQIDALAFGHLRDVSPRGQTVSYAEQERAVLAAYPGAALTQVAPAPADDRATEFDITTAEGASRRVYVDPYAGTVTGARDPGNSLTSLALDLHGMLLTNRALDDGGMWGDRIIELAASWSVVLVITGVYLWWPRGRRRKRDAFVPRLRSRSRTRWRDVHAITGVLFSFVTLFFLVTGLAWAGIFGAKIWTPLATKLGASYPAGTYDGASSTTVADLVEHGKAAWAAGELPVPASASAPAGDPGTGSSAPAPQAATAGGPAGTGSSGGGKPGHAGHEGHRSGTAAAHADLGAARPDVTITSGSDHHTGHAHAGTITWDPSKGAPIDAIVGRAQRLGFGPGFTVSYPADREGSYALFQFPDADVEPNGSATDERVAYVDQYTALPIRQYDFSSFGPLAKATDFGIAVHEGREWGIWSQLLSLLGSLAHLLSCATAIVMWRKRKPKGLGAPRKQPDRQLGIGVVAITLVLAAVLPVLGASLVALLLLDQLVRRIPRLARALGAGG